MRRETAIHPDQTDTPGSRVHQLHILSATASVAGISEQAATFAAAAFAAAEEAAAAIVVAAATLVTHGAREWCPC